MINTVIRIQWEILPFTNIYKPFDKRLIIGTCVFKTLASLNTCWNIPISKLHKIENPTVKSHIVNALVNICALVGTIFFHPLGVFIATVHNTRINILSLKSIGPNAEAMKAIFLLANDAFYFMALAYGSLGCKTLSMACQILLGSSTSISGYKGQDYLKCAGHALMTAILANQLFSQKLVKI